MVSPEEAVKLIASAEVSGGAATLLIVTNGVRPVAPLALGSCTRMIELSVV
jgi:hypothetical protein